MAIPKKIHYCWFGGNPLPAAAVEYINSWKKFCPDYEIIEWNDSNFDLNCCTYVKEAYEAKKWAFVSDYARLWAMVNFGGVYMDTDVEMLKPIDEYLELHAFSGFESNHSIPTGIMACEKDFPLFRELLNDYKDRHFVLEDGSYDQTTNVVAITNRVLAHGLILNNTLQTVDGFTLYPFDYFCAKSTLDGSVKITENTRTVHHFSGSWHSETQKKVRKIEQWAIYHFGEKAGYPIGRVLNFPFRAYEKIEKLGFIGTIKFSLLKLAHKEN